MCQLQKYVTFSLKTKRSNGSGPFTIVIPLAWIIGMWALGGLWSISVRAGAGFQRGWISGGAVVFWPLLCCRGIHTPVLYEHTASVSAAFPNFPTPSVAIWFHFTAGLEIVTEPLSPPPKPHI